MLHKNQTIFGAVCTGYTSKGEGVFKVEGFPLFVKGAIQGEKCDVKVTLTKKNFGYGRLLSVVEESDKRVTPECPIASPCGGCSLLHMNYEEQLNMKKEHVTRLFRDITEDIKINPAPNQFRYRNKVQVPVDIEKNIGFYRTNTNDIVSADDCFLQDKYNNEIFNVIKKANVKGYDKHNWKGELRHVLIRKSNLDDEYMVTLISAKKDINEDLIASLAKLEKVSSIWLNTNAEETNVIMGKTFKHLHGKETITSTIGDVKFEISPESFFQINDDVTKMIYDHVKANIKGKKVLDAYCGVGSIGLFVADAAEIVTGVEINKKAVDNARANAKLNKITNINFVAQDATNYLSSIEAKSFDTIIIDPPRKGTTADLINAVAEKEINEVIYVSCDPATLARDVKRFIECGFKFESIELFDMFPNTNHVESVVILRR